MTTRLEIKVDGERKGTVNIITETNCLQITTNDKIISNGNYLFTEEEIKKMIIKRMEKEYPTKPEFLLSKTILTAGELYFFSKVPELLDNYIDGHKLRKGILLFYNLAYTGILIHNERVTGGIILKF